MRRKNSPIPMVQIVKRSTTIVINTVVYRCENALPILRHIFNMLCRSIITTCHMLNDWHTICTNMMRIYFINCSFRKNIICNRIICFNSILNRIYYRRIRIMLNGNRWRHRICRLHRLWCRLTICCVNRRCGRTIRIKI